MDNYDNIIALFNLEKKYQKSDRRNVATENVIKMLDILFTIHYPNAVKFDNNEFLPGNLTVAMNNVLKCFKNIKTKFNNLRTEEEKWVLDRLEIKLPYYSHSDASKDKNFYAQYSINDTKYINLKYTIYDYIQALEILIQSHKKEMSSSRTVKGAEPKKLLATMLRDIWRMYAYKPGKAKAIYGTSRFDTFIELGFNEVEEKLPDVKTINKYLEKEGNKL